jgi:PAS domain S-box-containing protein
MVEEKNRRSYSSDSHLGIWPFSSEPLDEGTGGTLQTVISELPIGVLVQSMTAEILTSNPKALELLGLSEDQLLGRSSFDPEWNVIHEDGTDFPGPQHPVPQALATHQSVRDVVMGVFRPATRDRVWLLVNAIPMLGPDGLVRMVICTFSDITERKRIQENLLRSEQLLRASQRLTKVGGWEWDVDAKTMTWTDEVYRIHDFEPSNNQPDPAERISRSLACYAPEDRTTILAAFQRCAELGEPYDLEFPFTTAKGRHLWIRTVGEATRIEGRVVKVLGNLIDITDRKQAESALRESDEQFASMAENSPVAIYRYSDRRGGLYYSPRTEEILGYSPKQLLAAPWLWRDAIDPEDLPKVDAAIRENLTTQTGLNLIYRIRDASGQQRWLRDKARCHRKPDGELIVDGVVSDMTEAHRAEEEKARLQAQLHRAQRMESLGCLAGGVAHDMNNVLGAIMGLASLHQHKAQDDLPLLKNMETIIKACERGGSMVKSLLSFAHEGLTEEVVIDLNVMVLEVVALLKRTTLQRVRLVTDLTEGLHTVKGDPAALSHALMNLCVNAVDAMAEGGTLTLCTRNEVGGWVFIEVADTGSGMQREVLDRALDPFFTTKDVGKGTGLGLSMVYNTMKAHRGEVDLQSEPGLGTKVRLHFPVCVSVRQITEQVPDPEIKRPCLALTVLLVDDDELIQVSMQALLEELGHHTSWVASGEEALAKLEAGFQPDVVVLDMNMPGLGGSGTLPLLRALRPTLPVLLATGRADQAALDLVEAHEFVTLLSKPFSMSELKHSLEVLRPS